MRNRATTDPPRVVQVAGPSRVTLFAWPTRSIQRKLDIYREWYNAERPIFGLGCRTPNELALSEATGEAESNGVWAGAESPAGPRASCPHPVRRTPTANRGGQDGRVPGPRASCPHSVDREPSADGGGLEGRGPYPLRETDPLKPALDVHRIAYRGDPNLIHLDIQIVRSVKRSA